jgi:hypothetical protein
MRWICWQGARLIRGSRRAINMEGLTTDRMRRTP